MRCPNDSFLVYCRQVIFFFNWNDIWRGIRGLVNMPLTTWKFLDFRVAEKEKMLWQNLFARHWRSRLQSACLAIRCMSKVSSRKQIGQAVLHGPYHVQESSKLNHIKTTMRAIRSLQITLIAKKSEVKLDTGYLTGVPDIIWGKRQVQWGWMWWKIEFRRRKLVVAFVACQVMF